MLTRLSHLFDNELDKLELEVYQKRMINASLAIGALGFIGSAIMFPNQPKHQLGGELALGSLLAFASAYVSQSRQDVEKRYTTYLDMNRTHNKQILSNEFSYQSAMNTIMGELKLAKDVRELPMTAQVRYLEKFQLHGLVALQPASNDSSPQSSENTTTVNVSKAQLASQMKAIEQRTNINMQWIDDEFIYSSCIIVGAKGSGKSHFMKWKATKYFLLNPDAKIYIFDPHFDKDDPATYWLQDMPIDILWQQVIFKNVEDIYKQFVNIRSEFNSRIKESRRLPKVQKIRIFWDEEENVKRNLSSDKFKFILETIDMIQDEGRKYGIEIDIGMHSLKKENTGIDSAALSQMNWLLFEKACYDPTTKYPSDFDNGEIKKVAKALQVPRNIGRTVVIIKVSDIEPVITVLPLLPIEKIQLSNDNGSESESPQSEQNDEFWEDDEILGNNNASSTNEPPKPSTDYYEHMIEWFKLCFKEYGKLPSNEEVRQAWKQLTGHNLHDEGLNQLIELLNKRM